MAQREVRRRLAGQRYRWLSFVLVRAAVHAWVLSAGIFEVPVHFYFITLIFRAVCNLVVFTDRLNALSRHERVDHLIVSENALRWPAFTCEHVRVRRKLPEVSRLLPSVHPVRCRALLRCLRVFSAVLSGKAKFIFLVVAPSLSFHRSCRVENYSLIDCSWLGATFNLRGTTQIIHRIRHLLQLNGRFDQSNIELVVKNILRDKLEVLEQLALATAC